jgi:hypothetical protein
MVIVARKDTRTTEVRKAFKLLADSYGIPLKEEDYPSVATSSEGFNYYNPPNRTIYLTPERLLGSTLFEETSHALRDLLQRRRGIASEKQDKQVQEFYGRAGETLGRYLADDAGLAYTFVEDPVRDMDNPETKERWLKRLLNLKKHKNSVRAIKTRNKLARQELGRITGDNYAALTKLFVDFQQARASSKEFQDRLGRLERDYRTQVSSVSKKIPEAISPIDLTQVKSYLGKYNYLRGALDIANGATSEEERRKLIERGIKFITETHNPRSFQFDIEFARIQNVALKTELGLFSHFTHRKPYKYAQQYSAQDLLSLEDFYALSDEEVRRRFFRRKEKPLEARVVALILIFSSLFFLLTLYRIKMTGFAFAFPPKIDFTIGHFFLTVLLILIIVLGFFKIRKMVKTKQLLRNRV